MDRYVEQIKSTIIEPDILSTYIQIHPEEYGNHKINTVLDKGFADIKALDKNIKTLGSKIDELFNRNIKRLDTVATIINAEKERLQDISMLCNSRTDYDNAIPLTDHNFTGTYSYDNGVFCSKTRQSSPTKAAIIDVTGNGYEGNKYVFQNKAYLEKIVNTKNRKYAVDNNLSTYWEYSRITASNTEGKLISDFNKDSSEAKCTITMKFDQLTNEIAIKSTIEGLKVIAIKYSNDNVNYKDLNMLPFIINKKEASYKNQDYIYGSNIIAFPNSLYLKITFESTSYLSDTIAFEKVIAQNNKTTTTTTVVPSAKRHVIRINDIECSRKQYVSTSTLKTGNLITQDTDVYAISVFANVYLPDKTPEDYVTFTLTVNGIDYIVKPVNSYSNGIKIIRFSQGKMPVEYTKYIGEKIKSAYLTINIKSKKSTITPYINNVKILLGGEV